MALAAASCTLSAQNPTCLERDKPVRSFMRGEMLAEDLALAAKTLGRNDRVVHVRELVNAFRVGLTNYLDEVMQDENRKRKLYAGASLWFTHMNQQTMKTFLKAHA